MKRGRVSPAAVLACPELVSLVLPAGSTEDEGAAAATVAQALRLAIEGMEDREALEVLFGLSPSTESKPLPHRREEAATLLGIKAESFRVRRESQLLNRLARSLVVELVKPQAAAGPSAGPSPRTGGKPRLFISASSQAEGLIAGLGLNLEGKAVITVWSEGTWPLSHTTIEALQGALDEADFAIFVLADDDFAGAAGRHLAARENVVLELGLSIGRLGRDRTFVLAPKGSGAGAGPVSDLAGITILYYEPGSRDRAATSQLAGRVWEDVQASGPRNRVRAGRGLEYGETDHIDMFADAAIGLDTSREMYTEELQRAVRWGQKVPAKFQFAHADGGRYWLRLCRSINYSYFQRAKKHLSDNASHLADEIHQAAGTSAVDLISLGCGDGSKDDIILRALSGRLAAREHLYYYPVEISDILLVEALRYISRHGLDRSRFRCKAILGDFTNLRSFSEIFDRRPNTNLFSVLGNAIGSFDESEIFASLNGAMLPGDLVLIEANVGDPAESTAMLGDDIASMWDFSTLEALGIPRESCQLGSELVKDVSIVPGTRTLVSYAVSSAEKENAKYMLSAAHHYDVDELARSFERQLGVRWIEVLVSDGVGLLLGQRSR